MTQRPPPRGRAPAPSDAQLRAKLAEAEETLEAIRSGAVDSIVVHGPTGERLFTLDDAERSYRILVEAMTEGAATLAEDGTVLYCNARFAQMLSRPAKKVMGAALASFVHTDQQATLAALLREGRRRDCKGEVLLKGKRGARHQTLLSVNAMKAAGAAGARKNVLCVVATDLSWQKRNDEMMASERLARSVLEQAAEAIIVCDHQGKITRASITAELLAGESPLFKAFEDAFPLLPSTPAKGLPPLAEAPRSLALAALNKQIFRGVPATLVRSDGKRFELLLSGGPLLGQRGKVLGCVVTLTDVTPLRAIEENLQSAISVRDEFLSIASHELRTPLTALQIQLQSLQYLFGKKALDGVERAAGKLETAIRQTERLTRLVDGLLDVSRITGGRFNYQLEEVDLSELTADVVDRFQEQAQRAGCQLQVFVEPNVVGTWDRLRLEQVLTNLLSNAIKYGPAKPILVKLTRSRADARLEVSDQGIGIPAEDAGRIFGRFERAVPSKHYGGLGLGLFVARQIVEAFGGEILVESRPGLGSTFAVTLPLPAQGALPVPAPSVSQARASHGQ